MVRAGVVSDELWEVLEPTMPQDAGRRGRPWNDHRLTLEGIIWRYRAGAPWRDLPAEFGPYQSVWQRHRRWSTDGTYLAMVAAVQRVGELSEDEVAAVISIDSTVVRAHQHAAGARRDSAGAVLGPAGDTGGWVESQEVGARAAVGAA
jgi:transposase